MSRFLFVVPPLTGHTNPAVSVATELTAAGHEVAWVAYPATVGHLLRAGARVFAAGDETGRSVVREERRSQRGIAAVKFLWERFILPIAREMAPAVSRAVAEFAPDLVVVDQQAVAGAIVAEREGLAWVTSATTSAEVVNPFHLVPLINEWIVEELTGLAAELGVPVERAGSFDPRFSPRLTLVYSTLALTGPVSATTPLAFVGPAVSGRPVVDDFPWAWLDGFDRAVLVSMGTESRDVSDRFLTAAVEAVAEQPYAAVVVGPAGPAGSAPANVLVRPRVPQLALLDRVDAVVSHAGHNTVCEALAAGVPLVVAPIRDDQPLIAGQVTAAGAGVRLSFPRAGAVDIRKAIETVLDEPSYRDCAAAVGRSFADAGGSATAAAELIRLIPGNNSD